MYEGIKFVFYVAFVKADNEEASKFCGHYGSNTGVSCNCRKCAVPTTLSGRSLVNFPPKLEPELCQLVADNNQDELTRLSQHNFKNAFWGIHFGKHDESGIHGACNFDVLHTIFNGILERTRTAFFEQVGKDSVTAKDLDALAKEYGHLLRRQSDRDMPPSSFTKGIMRGKLMAKEFEGVVLLIALLLRSTKGRELLSEARSEKFESENTILDWTLLVETLLGWIQWLKSDEMKLNHVKQSAWKNRYIMHLQTP